MVQTSDNKRGGHPTRPLPFFPQKTHKKRLLTLPGAQGSQLPGTKAGYLLWGRETVVGGEILFILSARAKEKQALSQPVWLMEHIAV